MPPKYGRGGYRRSGYTRTSYAKKRYSARTGPYSSRRKSYRLAASGNRKYTGAKSVYGVKSTVPTTMQPTRQRVEVKQHSHLDSAAEYTMTPSVVPVVVAATPEAAEEALVAEAAKVGVPLPSLEILWGPPDDSGVRTFRARPFASDFGRPLRHLTHLAEGFAHNHRVGRTVNVTGLQVMVTASSVIAREKVADDILEEKLVDRHAARKPTEWHVILLQEYQVPTNNSHLSLQAMLTTMFDGECCNNLGQLLIAPKNRYTADAHGKILMHKKIVIDEKRPTASRKYSLRFPKPLVVKYKGVTAGDVAENRLTLYVFPVVQCLESGLIGRGHYETDGDPAVDQYYTRLLFEASAINYNTVLYYTDP